MLKNNFFSAMIFEGFGRRFGRVFDRVFGTKMRAKRKNMILAKTLKISISSWENAYF